MKRLLLAVAVLMSASCGYALAGRGSSLPAHIRVIGVPTFKNATPVFDLDRLISDRVRTELLSRGRYRVVTDRTGVDAVVDATITNISYSPAATDQNRQASRYVISITASISFRDLKTNKEIWSNPSLTFRDEYQVTTTTGATSDAATFFGQETAALTRLANDFARSMVSAMLEAF